ncbi:MAG: DHH family phosphoesterase [Candidatus Diapherotrites archaeon]
MPSHSLSYHDFWNALSNKKVLFLTHERPDMDTLSSALALTHFSRSRCDSTFGITKPLTQHYQSQILFFPIQPRVITSFRSFDVIVCVDFRSPSQAGELSRALQSFNGKIILLDHHSLSPHEFPKKTVSLIKPHSIATAQMVTEMMIEKHFSFPPKIARALAIGIISDSARFMVANPQTFSLFDFLLTRSGVSYDTIFARAVPTPSIHERVGIIHSLKQAKLVSVDDFLIGAVIHPHQTSWIASILVQIGCDIGLSVSPSPDGVYSSIRLSNRIYSKLKLDATSIFRSLAQQHNGTSGGHARAAQLNLPPYISENIILDALMREIYSRARKKNKKAFPKIH